MADRHQIEKLLQVYSNNLPVFAADLLKIKLEAGGLVNFHFNETQYDLHNRLENLLSRDGKVRAIVLKPRREGMSTYIGARFFHKTIFNQAYQTYIITHVAKATSGLFKMVRLFYDKMPEELRPSTSEASKTAFDFDKTNSSYSLGTAGSRSGARSELAHLLHASEVAYWDNAEEVAASTFEIVGDEVGTEIIMESTGYPDTYFQEVWEKAVAGNSDYEPIFYPWYTSSRNESDDAGIIITPEEKELMSLYKGMNTRNIAFRRKKLGTYSEVKFQREYPATPADAFLADQKLAYIDPQIVQIASNRNNIEKPYAPKILGVDPSHTQKGDSVGLCIRQDDKVIKIAEFNRESVLDRAGVIMDFINKHGIDYVLMDAQGSGKEIYEILLSWGLDRRKIRIVYSASSADDAKLHPNKRNEMYYRMRNWLHEDGDIPNNMRFKAELSVTKEVTDSKGRLVLQSKKDMRSSPNLADALALTFAYPVRLVQATGAEVMAYG